jgi:hypothetical protein
VIGAEDVARLVAEFSENLDTLSRGDDHAAVHRWAERMGIGADALTYVAQSTLAMFVRSVQERSATPEETLELLEAAFLTAFAVGLETGRQYGRTG